MKYIIHENDLDCVKVLHFREVFYYLKINFLGIYSDENKYIISHLFH